MGAAECMIDGNIRFSRKIKIKKAYYYTTRYHHAFLNRFGLESDWLFPPFRSLRRRVHNIRIRSRVWVFFGRISYFCLLEFVCRGGALFFPPLYGNRDKEEKTSWKWRRTRWRWRWRGTNSSSFFISSGKEEEANGVFSSSSSSSPKKRKMLSSSYMQALPPLVGGYSSEDVW